MSYEVIYWPAFSGRAEPALFLLEEANQPYTIATDVQARIEKLAIDHPVFACPILIDGPRVLSQTNVIAEYLGRKHGFDVADEDRFAAAQLAYNGADIWREVYDARRDGDTAFLEERFPRWLDVLETSFAAPDRAFYFTDTTPSWVDYIVLNTMTLADYCWGERASDQLTARPRLASWFDRMKARPRIAAYLDRASTLSVAYPAVSAEALVEA